MTDSSASFVVECLQQARSGDTAARDRLFAACRSYVGILARANLERWLQAKVDASDLVQQTLLDAYRDFGRFEGKTEQEWLAWLRKILAHNASDAVRHYGQSQKRAARKEIPLGENSSSEVFHFEPAAPDASPSELAISHERELQLAQAIEELEEDYREVIVLRNISRLPFDEVAARLGRSRPAAQMLWMRAIQKLRTLLSEQGGSQPDWGPR